MRAQSHARLRAAHVPFLCLAVATVGRAQANPDAAVPCPDGSSAVVMCYGQHADCSIGFVADYDAFRFWGVEGDVVRVSAAGTQNCVDPRIEVRDASNATVWGPTSCNTDCYNQCVAAGAFVVPATGLYTIWINDSGDTETGSYTLHLEKVLPDYPLASLDPGAPPHTLSIGHRGDHDFVTFEGELGSQVRLLVNGASNCIDPYVEIFDPSGAPLASNPTATCSTDCYNACNFNVDIASLPLDGTYTVAVTDNGRSETGNVRLSLVCFFAPSGDCPDASVDGPVGASYCTSNPNSTGSSATIAGWGSTSVAANRLWLTSDAVPVGMFGMFYAGPSQQVPPLPFPPPSQGLRCVGAPFARFPISYTCDPGNAMRRVDLASLPYPMTAVAGQTWNFQFWFRDGSVTNATDALTLVFAP